VRDGTYYPVALNYADETGSVIGSYGFYDADGDLQPDPVEVAGGDVSAVNVELYPAARTTARANVELALDIARRQADDAELVRARTLDGPFFQSAYDDGTADLWGYEFHSASQQKRIYVAVDPINVFIDVDEGDSYDRAALTGFTVDSDQALAIADANGGTEFKAQYGEDPVPTYLDAGDLDLSVRPVAGEVFWRVRYRSPSGYLDDELNVFVDVETGDVLPASSIATEDEAVLPDAPRLSAAWPNPSSGRTIIPFELHRPDHVSVRVFDALGREVTTLVDAMRPAGRHTAEWDASGLPGGVYFVRLEARGSVRSRALTVLR
jgi:hypothetical protein